MRKKLMALVLSIVILFSLFLLLTNVKLKDSKNLQLQEDTSNFQLQKDTPNPQVVLETNLGSIRLELSPKNAPLTVENFLGYVDARFYDNTLFHRVIPGFMIQGGGFDKAMMQKTTKDPIKNEADNGLENRRGTIAMARTFEVDSATAQFFINTVDNDFLNHRSKSQREYGYCVFGQVIEGMDVVDKISQVRTHNVGMFENVPMENVIILSARRGN